MQTAPPANPAAPAPPMGVIDTLTAGLTVVARYPWLALLPLLLDLFLWRGPALYPSPALVQSIASPLQREAAALPGQSGEEAVAFYDSFDEVLGGLNLWRAGLPQLFWPSVLVAGSDDAPRAGWTIERGGTLAAVALVLALGGLALNVFWLHLLARASARERWQRLWPPPGALLRDAGRLVVLALLLVALSLLALLPASFIVALLVMAAPGAAQLLMGCFILTTLWFTFWLWLHLYFTAAAVVEGRQGALVAPLASMRLVRGHFWSAIGFILICLLLTNGFQVIWNLVGGSAAGRLLGFAGNAALGTGLAAAMMIFFRERWDGMMR